MVHTEPSDHWYVGACVCVFCFLFELVANAEILKNFTLKFKFLSSLKKKKIEAPLIYIQARKHEQQLHQSL